MKVFFFHLMPYGELDLSYTDRYDSVMTTLPNSYYEPEAGHRLYNRYLDELELADALGFDGICVNEHHQTAYGLMPSPIVTAAALTRRTSRAKIAIMGTAFGLRDNPLLQAEEHAMIDTITGGRLISGMVRGIGAEYISTGVNPTHSRERFEEAHDLVVQAWTRTGPFAFEGKHYNFGYVNIWPRPFQQPHPPIWIPSQGSRETVEFAAHPDRKYVYLQTYTPFAVAEKFLNLYRQVAREQYGYEAAESQLGWAVPAYVAETDAQALAEARPHIETFFSKFLHIPPHMMLPPGYVSLASHGAAMSATRKRTHSSHSMEQLIEQEMFIVGSPQTVADKIKQLHARGGFGYALLMLQFATLPANLTRRCTELFAREVLPQLHPVGSERPHANQ